MLVLPPLAERGSLLSERLAKPEFAQGSTPRRIQDDGHVRIGLVPDAPGFSARNSTTGKFEGVDVSIARRLAQGIFGGSLFDANAYIDLVEIDFTRRASVLENREVDFVASVYAVTDERRKQVNFTRPYFSSPLSAVARTDTSIESMDELGRLRIAVGNDTVEAQYAARNGFGSKVVEVAGNTDMIRAVIDGRADVGLASSVILDEFVIDNPEIRRLPWQIDDYTFGIGVTKGDTHMTDFLDHRLDELVNSGFVTLAEACRRRRR